METAQNSSALTALRLKQNVEEVTSTRIDLNNWVKSVKDKEQKLNIENTSEQTKTPPIRSHIAKTDPMSIPEMAVKANADVIAQKKQKFQIEAEQDERKDRAEAFNESGNKHVKLQDYKTAILQYTSAIETFSEDPKYFTNRALCFLRLESYSECIDDCNRAIELDKLNIKAYYRRMQANECLNFNTQALQDCTTVLMIDAKNRDAKISLQRINQRLKNSGAIPKGHKISEPMRFKEGPNFSPLRSNMVDIFPVNKLSSSRSKKQLKQINVIDVIGPKDGKNFENSNIQISDEVIDKLFNGDSGSFEEVKKTGTINAKNQEKDTQSVPQKKPIVQIPTNCEAEVTPATNPIVQKIKVATPTNCEAEVTLPTKNKPLPPAPISTAQFYCNWKELSVEQKYQYLKSIPKERLNQMLGAGFDSETLTNLLAIFSDYYVRNDDDLCGTLLEICKNDRMKIFSLMLSEQDTEALTKCLDYLKDKARQQDIDFIKTSFYLK